MITRLALAAVLLTLLSGCAAIGEAMYGSWRDGLVEDVGVEARTVTVKGRPVAAYLRKGRDPVLVLHGFTSNKEGWLTTAAELATAA